MKGFIVLSLFVSSIAWGASLRGPLKKFPFHPDGLYSRETTSTVMGMTHTQSGDVCFRESTGDYTGHIPDATKCTTKILKDTETEGTWTANCTTAEAGEVKVSITITSLSKDSVKSTFDIDAPQGVKVKGQHVFKYLKAECPKIAKKDETKANTKAPTAASECDKLKQAMAACASIPGGMKTQCENSMKQAHPAAKNCK